MLLKLSVEVVEQARNLNLNFQKEDGKIVLKGVPRDLVRRLFSLEQSVKDFDSFSGSRFSNEDVEEELIEYTSFLSDQGFDLSNFLNSLQNDERFEQKDTEDDEEKQSASFKRSFEDNIDSQDAREVSLTSQNQVSDNDTAAINNAESDKEQELPEHDARNVYAPENALNSNNAGTSALSNSYSDNYANDDVPTIVSDFTNNKEVDPSPAITTGIYEPHVGDELDYGAMIDAIMDRLMYSVKKSGWTPQARNLAVAFRRVQNNSLAHDNHIQVSKKDWHDVVHALEGLTLQFPHLKKREHNSGRENNYAPPAPKI